MSELTYFKRFSTKADYDTYINGSPILPNVSFVDMDVFYKDKPDYSSHYLTFKITSAGDIKWYASNTAITRQISYSKDSGTSWTEITSNTGNSAPSISVNAGDTIIFKGTNDTYSNGNHYSCFSGSTAMFEVDGNIMSLCYGDNFKDKIIIKRTYTFYSLFNGCTGLTSAENLVLPATTLAQNCYNGMFRECSLLTTAPVLPATTLAQSCYYGMFNGCTSLTSAPSLPATTLADSCYNNMFNGCTSLTTAPELPATTLTTSCYSYMFWNCSSLTSPPVLSSTILATGCYTGMFQGCTSLTTAPELPATTLAPYCYTFMFRECSSLTTAPELPVTTLTTSCYQEMFRDCSSLNYIKCLATDISASQCTFNWVSGVASTGRFVKAASMTGWTTGTSSIPNNWTVQDAA